MTRKDYRLISGRLNERWQVVQSERTYPLKRGFYLAMNAIMDALQDDNPRFKRSEFEDAVYGPVLTKKD